MAHPTGRAKQTGVLGPTDDRSAECGRGSGAGGWHQIRSAVMRLTSEQFGRLLMAVARQPPGAAAGGVRDDQDERRSEPRVPADGVVVLMPENADDVPIHARLRNISRGGVGFTHHNGLPKGRRMTVHLPTARGEDQVPVLCEVRHCEQTGETTYTIGVAFLD